MNINELSLQVRQKRGKRGIRQISKEIGISTATLSRVESGKQPDLQNFAKICKWLEVDPNSILGFSSNNDSGVSPISAITYAHLRADREMSEETVHKLADLILSVQQAFIDKE